MTPPSTLDSTVVATADELAAGTVAFNVGMALSEAGFEQMSADGTDIFPAQTPAMGIAFEQGDADVITSGLVDGPRLSIDDLLGGWAALAMSHSTSDADWTAKVAAMRAALVRDLTIASLSTKDTHRFWAQLIVQLGRISPEAYDLLDPAVPGTSLLDPMQVALLTYRFQAELWAAGRKAAGLSLQPRPTLPGAVATPRPCTMTDTQGTIMDGAALGTTTLMGTLIDEVGKTVASVEKFGKFAGGANAALTIVKVLWTFLAFEAHITADTNLLFRNYDGTAGGAAQLTASFKFNSGNAQVVNCIRPALNALGIDFNLPQDGPIAGAGVDWEMFNVWERTAKLPIIRYTAGTIPLGRRTNDAGEDAIDVEGSPKKPALTGTVVPDYRSVGFAAKVALKDTKIAQDLIDAVGAAATANPALMALTVITETLYRAKTLVFSGHYRLPVEDHQTLDNVIITAELNGAVSGTITASGQGSESASASVYLLEKPAPSAQPMTFVLVNNNPAVGALQLAENALRTVDYHANGTFIDPCVCVAGDQTTTLLGGLSGTSTTDGGALTLIATVQPDGTYSMDIPLGSVTARGTIHSATSGCGDTPASSDKVIASPYSLGKVTVTGTLDLTKPSGTIEGTLSADVVDAVPYTAGGYYASGAAQSTLHLTGPVKYVVSYTLTKLTIPGAPTPPPAARAPALLAAEPAVAPAFTSWLAEQRAARVRACLR